MTPLRSTLLVLNLGLAFGTAAAQCGVYRYHPLWPDTSGTASVLLTDCSGATGVLWDNGDTTEYTYSLTVGPHSVTLFDGTTPIETMDFIMEQQVWALNQHVGISGGAVEVAIYAEVDHCTPLIFDNVDCEPDPEQTIVRLIQDGIVIDTLTPVDCIGTGFHWYGLPFGHTYGTALQAMGPCQSDSEGPIVTAYDCSELSMELQVQQDGGGGTGSIAVTGLVPGPPGPFVPTWPITGSFVLFDQDMNVVSGGPQNGSTAEWSGLVPGTYQVMFYADSLCSPVSMNVVMDTSTGISGPSQVAQVLWPIPVTNSLHWRSGKLCHVRVLDAVGRTILRTQGIDQLDVSSLSAGTYLLRLDDGPPRSFVKR